MSAVAFDRIEKAWMTVTGGGDDEIPEVFEVEWDLVDYPAQPVVLSSAS